MVRSALATRSRSPRAAGSTKIGIPAATVVGGSLLSPSADRLGDRVVARLGLADAAGVATSPRRRLAGLVGSAAGLLNDLVIRQPDRLLGRAVAAMMLAMDIVDRRTMWRDYWIEWAMVAALFIALAEAAQWQVAGWSSARRSPSRHRLPAILCRSSPSRVARYRLAP